MRPNMVDHNFERPNMWEYLLLAPAAGLFFLFSDAPLSAQTCSTAADLSRRQGLFPSKLLAKRAIYGGK